MNSDKLPWRTLMPWGEYDKISAKENEYIIPESEAKKLWEMKLYLEDEMSMSRKLMERIKIFEEGVKIILDIDSRLLPPRWITPRGILEFKQATKILSEAMKLK